VIESVITEVQRFSECMKDNQRSRIAYLCTLGVVLATWDIRSNKCVLKMSFTRIFSSLATERASFSTLLFILLF
jgi:hypothetical protein